jgi:hypothetical protein
VVTDKESTIYNPTNEYIFPSFFHAGAYLGDPLGEWYLYLVPHDPPAGIMLMYADSLDGPWTEYPANPMIARSWPPHYSVSHVSSPDAIWNEEAGKVFLYFHGENSQTRFATSSDGIRFEYGGIAVSNGLGGPAVTETSYARVFEHPDPASDYHYGMIYMANYTDNHRRLRHAESVDGITWDVRPDPIVEPESGASLLQQELPDGPWQVTTKVHIEATQRFQQAGLLLYASDTVYGKFDLGRATPDLTLEVVQHVNGSNRQDTAAPAVPGATDVWLRLTSDGVSVQPSVSYDGQTFTNYGRAFDLAHGFTHVGPYAFRGALGAPEIEATFDWFRWSPTPEEYAQCLANQLPADDETVPPDGETAPPATA